MKTKYWFILGTLGFAALLHKCNQMDIERRNAQQAKPKFEDYLEQALGRKVTHEELEAIHAADEKTSKAMDDEVRRQYEAQQRREEGCGGVHLAVAAEQYVRRQLRTPSVASFSTYTDRMLGEKDGRLYYLGYVDSQNGFGAMVRMHFKVWMTCYRGDITVVDAEFE